MTWEESKENADVLISLITDKLTANPPNRIADILKAVTEVDSETGAIPNPAPSGIYGQLILYPSKKWNTWSQISMSISKYGV